MPCKAFRDFFDAGDKGIGFVSSYDLRINWYHPRIKIPAGERAAKWALVSQYGILKGADADQYWLPPVIKEVEICDSSICLKMNTTVRTRDDSDGKLLGFAIAGKDRCFYPADINWYTDGSLDNRNRPNYQRDILVLRSAFVPNPVHFRYAWARNPMANIVNPRGVPLATQRSDDWLLEATPVKVNDFDRKSNRQILNELRQILKKNDTERRFKEAESMLK